MIRRLPVWLLALVVFGGPAAAQTITTIQSNGPTSQRINIVFLSEGYTSNELALFPTHARETLDKILGAAPLTSYSNCFNAYAISVASVESGSDHPSRSVYKDTYFNSTFDYYGIARLINIDNTGRNRAYTLLASLMPEYDLVAMIVNDTEYGGSGGSVLLTSRNTSAPEVAVHELGHTFAGLGDEYGDAYPGYPDAEEPNTTTQTNRALLKWNVWVDAATPVPTPGTALYQSVVGLFEGAHYHVTNWFRPKYNCKMRTLNVPFCEVCAETLVKRIYALVDPLNSFTPPTNQVYSVTNAGLIGLSVAPLVPRLTPLSVQWYANSQSLAGATNATLNLNAYGLSAGTNLIRAEVADLTPLVRTDLNQDLKQSVVWRVISSTSPVNLAASRAGQQLSLAWPATASGFRVETAASTASGSPWTPLLVISNQTGLSLPATNARTFLRLRAP